MTATTAYFVHTVAVVSLRLPRPRLATATAAPAVPASLPVGKGWNLVPVLTDRVPLLKSVPAHRYFGTLVTSTGVAAWLRALWWDAGSQRWVSVGPDDAPVRVLSDTGDTFTDRCGQEHEARVEGQEVLEPLCVGEGGCNEARDAPSSFHDLGVQPRGFTLRSRQRAALRHLYARGEALGSQDLVVGGEACAVREANPVLVGSAEERYERETLARGRRGERASNPVADQREGASVPRARLVEPSFLLAQPPQL